VITRSATRVCIVVGVVLAACGGHNNNPGTPPPSDGGGGADTPDANQGCGLVTCATAGAMCGPIGDGCGGVIDCGTCTPPETCGGGGQLFTCGGGGPGSCTPRTCADAGAECGVVADGCGGVTTDCGNCPSGETCGGGGVANVCARPACTGLCQDVNACTGQPKTSISGTVTAPGHANTQVFGVPDPIYGALVYIPNGAAGAPTFGVTPFPQGVSCDSCSTLTSGDPLVSAVTDVDGKFTLSDVPCGTNIPLVIQLGRWRRQITIPSVACCANTALTNAQTHLPRDRVGEPGDVYSDIPLMAFSTGSVDTLHCVLRKIGIADTEFTDPAGAGRIRFYKDNGAQIDAATPPASALFGSAAELAKYDMTLFECVGNRVPKALADQNRLVDYSNAGGRIFATHYSYVWLTNSTGTLGTNTAPSPFFRTADWLVDANNAASVTGFVDRTAQGDTATQTRRIAFANWLQLVGASTTLGEIPVNVVRNDFTAVNTAPATASGTPAQRWLFATTPFSAPLHYTFDTPIAYAPDPKPTKQCGRVLYSDFHVSDATSAGATFPAECSAGPMTAQEKTLEFMLFDLASCVGPPPVAQCTPKSCADQGFNCGQSGDGCDDGAVLDCGTCQTNQVCGTGSGGNVCQPGPCMPRTCADVGAQCGIIGDGCGGTVDCGTCPTNQVCGGPGMPNVCTDVIIQ
jgi:hypothetical protein